MSIDEEDRELEELLDLGHQTVRLLCKFMMRAQDLAKYHKHHTVQYELTLIAEIGKGAQKLADKL